MAYETAASQGGIGAIARLKRVFPFSLEFSEIRPAIRTTSTIAFLAGIEMRLRHGALEWLSSCDKMERSFLLHSNIHRRSMVNLLPATPRSQPLPVPARASDTSPLVTTCALLDLSAPAWASTEAYDPMRSLTE